MTAPDPKTSAKTPNAKTSAARLAGLAFFTLILVAAAALVIAIEFHPAPGAQRAAVAVDMAPLGEKVTALEQKETALEDKVNELSARLGQGPAAAGGPLPANSAAEIARLQNDVAVLSAGFGGLQGQIKQVNETALVTVRAARTSLALALTFMQLRQEAEAGHGFAPLLAAMRAAAAGDPNLEQILAALEPYAGTGVPPLPVLQEQFSSLLTPATQEFARDSANTWWQRILAELRSLVSIRPINGSDSLGSVLTSIESSLTQADVGGALEHMKALPPGTQAVLDKWRAEAEARARTDAALNAIADRLRAAAETAAPAPATAPPQDAAP